MTSTITTVPVGPSRFVAAARVEVSPSVGKGQYFRARKGQWAGILLSLSLSLSAYLNKYRSASIAMDVSHSHRTSLKL